MNERIKLLASQCWIRADHLGPDWFDQDKFAQLIIQECCSIAREKTSHSAQVVEAIEQRFGVQ